MKKSINLRLSESDLKLIELLGDNRTKVIESLISDKRMKMMCSLACLELTFAQSIALIEFKELELNDGDTFYRIDEGRLLKKHKSLDDDCGWTNEELVHIF